MTTKFNEIPTHGPRGEGGVVSTARGSEGPGRESVTARDPLPPSIWDGLYDDSEPYETRYRKRYTDYYGDDYFVETDIDTPRYPIVADFIWGGVIFGTGFLLGLVLGSIVGGGVW